MMSYQQCVPPRLLDIDRDRGNRPKSHSSGSEAALSQPTLDLIAQQGSPAVQRHAARAGAGSARPSPAHACADQPAVRDMCAPPLPLQFGRMFSGDAGDAAINGDMDKSGPS